MPNLRNTYGEMIIKKGTVLYHSSDRIFTQNLDKPMLFLTFHPSEYIKKTKYVTSILLNKDISLLFMIIGIRHDVDIKSALGRLIQQSGGRHRWRKLDKNLSFYKSYLEKENFNGWFSSIDDDFETEIALINNQDAFSVISSEEIMWDWERPHRTSNGLMDWGSLYTISIIPINLNVSIRYKAMLEKYMENIDKDIFGVAFLVVLKNAIVTYYDSVLEKNLLANIIWRFE